jgi:hypothetical protein
MEDSKSPAVCGLRRGIQMTLPTPADGIDRVHGSLKKAPGLALWTYPSHPWCPRQG